MAGRYGGSSFDIDDVLLSMKLAYAVALAEARSCLAALADGAADFDKASHFEHRLLDLDRFHPIGLGLADDWNQGGTPRKA